MRVSESHEIDRKAETMFRSMLPVDRWVISEQQHPDYAKDFLVEFVSQGQLTGTTFIAQLKGKKSMPPSHKGRSVSISLDTKHVTYYVDKVRQPVFLITVDVTRNLGYWLFLQEHVLETLKNKNWRSQKSIRIRIPIENQLHNDRELEITAKRAERFMNALRPADLTTAIKANCAMKRSLDPRYDVGIEFSEGIINYTYTPKEVVRGILVLKGPPDETRHKIRDLVERGLPIQVEPGELESSGSPLLKEALEGAKEIRMCREFPAHIQLVAKKKCGNEIGKIDSIAGKLAGGTRELRFEGKLPGSPLNVRFTINQDNNDGINVSEFAVSFLLKQWFGQRISILPFFDQIFSVFGQYTDDVEIEFVISILGNRLLEGTMDLHNSDHFQSIAECLNQIEKIRFVGKELSLTPCLPQEFPQKDADDLKRLYDIVRNGEHRARVRSLSIKLHLDRSGADQFLTKNTKLLKGPLCLTLKDQKFPFLGESVNIGPVKYTIPQASMKDGPASIVAQLADSNKDSFVVEYVAENDSELIAQRARANE